MAIAFRCPDCSKLLRTTDDKVGLQANCPGCGNVVTVPAAGADPDASSVGSPLSTPGPSRTIEPFDAFFGPTDADYGEEDDADDDAGDGPRCPMCGERIPVRARICRHCGEAVSGRRERRDAPLAPGVRPHRTGLLLTLSIVGVASFVFSGCCLLLGVVSIPFPVAVLILANGDLARMRDGEMDRRGESETRTARIIALIHLGLAAGGILLYVVLVGLGAIVPGFRL